jgi:hypothetical protein
MVKINHQHIFPLSLFFCLFYIIVILGVHCDIYKRVYNISQLNPPPLSFSFIPPPLFLEQFRQVSLFHFHTWIHSTSIRFAFLHPFLMSFPSHWYQYMDRTCLNFLTFFFKKKTFLFIYDGYTGSFIVIFPYIYVCIYIYTHIYIYIYVCIYIIPQIDSFPPFSPFCLSPPHKSLFLYLDLPFFIGLLLVFYNAVCTFVGYLSLVIRI